jgi:hypothetical protein
VLTGMEPTDKPVEGPKNNPMMPIAWTRVRPASPPDVANPAVGITTTVGRSARSFTTTMGAATDLQSEGLRRLLVNACYWGLGMEDKIPERSNVAIVGTFKPSKFSFGGSQKGLKPADMAK